MAGGSCVNLLRRPRWLRRLGGAGLVVVLVAGVSCSRNKAATESTTELCDQFASMPISDRYVIRNNRFGGQGGWQCIDVSSTGFSISQLAGIDPSGRPIGYPSAFYGCSYDSCSPDSALPKRLSEVRDAGVRVSFSYVDRGSWDAVSIIDLDPVRASTGDQQTEIIIYFNQRGLPPAEPDQVRPDTMVAGRTWQVREIKAAGDRESLVSYVSPDPITDFRFNAVDFINDVRRRNLVKDDWYLNNIQAGFECRSGCIDLAVTSFEAAVNQPLPP